MKIKFVCVRMQHTAFALATVVSTKEACLDAPYPAASEAGGPLRAVACVLLTPARPPGLRLGMYGPLKTAVGADADPTLARKILAGSLSGGIATLITNPMELIKTRLQSNSAQGGALAVVRKVVAADGITGLWKGTMPSAVRFSFCAWFWCAKFWYPVVSANQKLSQ